MVMTNQGNTPEPEPTAPVIPAESPVDYAQGVPVPVGTVPVATPQVPRLVGHIGDDGIFLPARPEGSLVPGEPGAPPVAPYVPPADIGEVPFAQPPAHDPGVPITMLTKSKHPVTGEVLDVAPGTIVPGINLPTTQIPAQTT